MRYPFSDHPRKEEVTTPLSRWALNKPEIQRLLVYGSRARGDYRGDSDLDLAVELRPSETETTMAIWMFSRAVWHGEVDPLIPWKVHLEWHDQLNGKTPTVTEKIAKGSYIIFQREV